MQLSNVLNMQCNTVQVYNVPPPSIFCSLWGVIMDSPKRQCNKTRTCMNSRSKRFTKDATQSRQPLRRPGWLGVAGSGECSNHFRYQKLEDLAEKIGIYAYKSMPFFFLKEDVRTQNPYGKHCLSGMALFSTFGHWYIRWYRWVSA